MLDLMQYISHNQPMTTCLLQTRSADQSEINPLFPISENSAFLIISASLFDEVFYDWLWKQSKSKIKKYYENIIFRCC